MPPSDALAPTTPGSRFGRFASDVLSVRPGEGTRTALLFSQLFLASAVFVMGRTVRDTLFLSRYSISALPWMFVLYGVASAITVVVYSRIADKLVLHKAIVGWTALGIVTYLGSYACIKAEAAWIYPVFYVWAEVFANLLISQFWTLANDLHDARSAKRLFGTIGAARVLGIIAVGLGTGSIVRLIGTEQLMLVLAVVMALIALIALRLGREPRAHPRAAQPLRAKAQKPPPPVAGDAYVRVLSLMMLLCFAALTVGDYQFKAIARATYREDALASFFSFFYAGTGIVSFVVQIFATPRLLARFGVGVGMSVMPAVFGGASAMLLGLPILPVATVMKFADNGFQYSIHETTLQALYVPFPASVKVRTRAFLDAVIKPIAYGVGGLLLIVFVPRVTHVQQLSYVSVALVLGWGAAIPVVRRRYTKALEKTLRSAGLAALGDEPVRDASGRKVVLAALGSEDPRVVLAALDELGDSSEPEVLAALESLARHEDPAIRVGALTRLGPHARATSSRADDEVIRRAITDAVPEVRAAAATAHAMATRDESVDALGAMLDDESRQVRTAVLAGLLAYAGFEGAMLGGARLTTLLGSERPKDRADGAKALGAIGASGVRRLSPLLDDEAAEVRVAAIDAAREIADPRLLPRLLGRFDDPSTRGAAGTAIAAVGEPSIAPLIELMTAESTSRATALAVPRVLRGVRSRASYEALMGFVGTPDDHLRLRVLAALSRLRESLRLPPVTLDFVRHRVRTELREIYVSLRVDERDRETLFGPLLLDLVEHGEERCAKRILRLLELRYEPGPLRLVRERIEDAARVANALEVLDTTLEPALRPIVMPFFDDVAVADKLETVGDPQLPSSEAFLAARCADPNPYVVLVYLDAMTRCAHPALESTSCALATHANPLVREAAALGLLAAQGRHRALLEALGRDGDRQVARIATACLARLEPHAELEIPMYSTVEKLLLLRTAPMFAKLRGEDLAPLARAAEVESYDEGEKIFSEGDAADALYVVVRGSVGIERSGERLATFGSGEPFGEMAVLDSQPRSADAVASSGTEVLRIGSEEFYDALHEQVEIAEGVLRMLSRRLREANEIIEASNH